MKKLVFLLTFVCVSMLGFAQNQMAILQHNDTITNTYYGTGAFVSAYNAAADGDIITLSAGRFNVCNIAKAITIRGAGSRSENGNSSTILDNGYLTYLESTTSMVHVEGVALGSQIYVNGGANAQFVRCIFSLFGGGSSDVTVNLGFFNCLFQENSFIFSSNSSVDIVNSVLYKTHRFYYCNIHNSFINFDSSNDVYYLNGISFNNCIITSQWGSGTGTSPNSSNTFYNCVAINMPNLFKNINGGIGTNTHRSAMSDVFETFTGGTTMNYYEEYILKEDFATSFLGSDGTEVGIHGGMMPFSLDPSYMIVKSCNVASKSTIDGKLSVDIEIETEE